MFIRLPAAMSLFLIALFAITIQAQEPKEKAPDKADVLEAEISAEVIELIATAYRTADVGERTNSPETLVAAASMFKWINDLTKAKLNNLNVKLTDESGKEIESKLEKTTTFETEVTKLFGDASDMAARIDPNLTKSIDGLIKLIKERKPDLRAAVGGPKNVTRSIQPGESHVYSIEFKTGLPAAFSFRSTNASLRCKMSYRGYVHFEQVVRFGNYSWIPKPDKNFKDYTIVIKNESGKPTTYTFFAN